MCWKVFSTESQQIECICHADVMRFVYCVLGGMDSGGLALGIGG